MIHLAASLLFIVALLAAAVCAHLTVRDYWRDILLALRGELGLEVRPVAAPRQPHRRMAPIAS